MLLKMCIEGSGKCWIQYLMYRTSDCGFRCLDNSCLETMIRIVLWFSCGLRLDHGTYN
jgi:hypothetical protein